jgi:hypothetical protein
MKKSQNSWEIKVFLNFFGSLMEGSGSGTADEECVCVWKPFRYGMLFSFTKLCKIGAQVFQGHLCPLKLLDPLKSQTDEVIRRRLTSSYPLLARVFSVKITYYLDLKGTVRSSP